MTIIFCVDIEHAERMRRALINENAAIVKGNLNYIMKITGVDCKTCKLLVIDKIINSPIIFKQIIGHGTRLFPNFDKNYFTIMDFRNATRLFFELDFEGAPVVIINGANGTEEPPAPPSPRQKYYVNGVAVNIVKMKFFSISAMTAN